MGEVPEVEVPTVDVLFVGQTGIGKSSLINMIRGVSDNAREAAKVSNDAHPCTTETTSYSTTLEGLECRLWDMRGLGEAVGVDDGWFKRITERIRQRKTQQHNQLEKELRDRTRLTTPILVWCIDAPQVDISAQYEPLQKAYVDYCGKKAKPVIVITRMRQKEEAGWNDKCRRQLGKLNLGEEFNVADAPLLRVRHRRAPSTEYEEDAVALRKLIYGLIKR